MYEGKAPNDAYATNSERRVGLTARPITRDTMSVATIPVEIDNSGG